MQSDNITPSPRIQNLVGQTFNQLTAISFAGVVKKRTLWLWECTCGERKVIEAYGVKSGSTKSCGCLNLARVTTHNQSGLREYAIYRQARQRCENPQNHHYDKYGGRGIEFRFKSFEEFIEVMGLRPSDKPELDRIDNNGHYEKGNLRWATRGEQMRNTRRNRNYTLDGVTQCLTDWCKFYQISFYTVHHRITRGWSIERALTQRPHHRTPTLT